MHDWTQLAPTVLLLWLVFVAMSIHSKLERIGRSVEDLVEHFVKPDEDEDHLDLGGK